MVDRIVPRTPEADRAQVNAALGLEDAWPVVGERFLEWVVEDDFAAGRPADIYDLSNYRLESVSGLWFNSAATVSGRTTSPPDRQRPAPAARP